jgi:hypothetical protein
MVTPIFFGCQRVVDTGARDSHGKGIHPPLDRPEQSRPLTADGLGSFALRKPEPPQTVGTTLVVVGSSIILVEFEDAGLAAIMPDLQRMTERLARVDHGF